MNDATVEFLREPLRGCPGWGWWIGQCTGVRGLCNTEVVEQLDEIYVERKRGGEREIDGGGRERGSEGKNGREREGERARGVEGASEGEGGRERERGEAKGREGEGERGRERCSQSIKFYTTK